MSIQALSTSTPALSASGKARCAKVNGHLDRRADCRWLPDSSFELTLRRRHARKHEVTTHPCDSTASVVGTLFCWIFNGVVCFASGAVEVPVGAVADCSDWRRDAGSVCGAARE